MQEYNIKERKYSNLRVLEDRIDADKLVAVNKLIKYFYDRDNGDMEKYNRHENLGSVFRSIQYDEGIEELIKKDKLLMSFATQKKKDLHTFVATWRTEKQEKLTLVELIGTALRNSTTITMQEIELIEEIAIREYRYILAKEGNRDFKHKVMGKNQPSFLGKDGIYKIGEITKPDIIHLIFYAIHFNIGEDKEIIFYDAYKDMEYYVKIKDIPSVVYNRVLRSYRINTGYHYERKDNKCPCGNGKLIIKKESYDFFEKGFFKCENCCKKYKVTGNEDWYLETEIKEILL